MKINIFDKNFITYDKSSTFGKAPRSFEYVKNQRNFDGITLFTDKCFNQVHNANSKYNIAWQVESPVHSDKDFYPMLKYADKFDMIFTYDEELVQKNPKKFKRVNFGGTTVSNPMMYPKTKDICIVHSGKNDTPNHAKRVEVIKKYDIDVYGKVTGKRFKNIQDIYRDYRFAIVIENINHDNYFSEKLTDAMACGTMPIYCGSFKSVDALFNPRGVCKWDSLESLDASMWSDQFDEAFYERYRDGIEDNLKKATTEFYTNEDWLYNNYIRNFINEQER